MPTGTFSILHHSRWMLVLQVRIVPIPFGERQGNAPTIRHIPRFILEEINQFRVRSVIFRLCIGLRKAFVILLPLIGTCTHCHILAAASNQ
jgi:hypothetical protein